MFAHFARIGVGHEVQLQVKRVLSDIHDILEVDEEPEDEDLSQCQAESSRGYGDPSRASTSGTRNDSESILDSDVDMAQDP